jgi:hypothetical protein
MNKPRNVEVTAIKIMLPMALNQRIPERSARKAAKRIGTKALTMPKAIAPTVLASINRFKSMGAKSKRSKERMLTGQIEMMEQSLKNAKERLDKLEKSRE